MDGMMWLAEVEVCERAYIVYEPEDNEARLFWRRRTDEDNILFERDLGKYVKSCPYFMKKMYGKP